jgi:hypothetical protein
MNLRKSRHLHEENAKQRPQRVHSDVGEARSIGTCEIVHECQCRRVGQAAGVQSGPRTA